MRCTLTALANKYRSDKGTDFGNRHGYTHVYERLFEPRRDETIRLLEIGLRHDPYYGDQDHTVSPSLEMWLEYFPNAHIFGFDINDFSAMQRERLRVIRGDQGRMDDLLRLADGIGEVDFIIDDGSHASFHQQLSFRVLFPCLRQGGIYIVEDLDWQPGGLEAELPHVPTTRELFASPAILAFLDVSFHFDQKLLVVQAKRTTTR